MQLVTASKAALILGVSRQRVHQMIQEGKLKPASTIRGRKGVLLYQFDRADVERLREDN